MAKIQLKTADDDHALEHTRARIYAYLHALQPLSGCDVTSSYHRGRELVALLAESSKGYGKPKRKLALCECAEIIQFMHHSEPRKRATFYKEPHGQPSIECGFHIVLIAVEDSLRRGVAPKPVRKTRQSLAVPVLRLVSVGADRATHPGEPSGDTQ